MSDLVTFLNARLDEDEAAARAATEGPWKVEVFNRHTGKQEWVVIGRTGSQAVTTGEVGVGWMAGLPHDGTHIARHDPGRALREVEADRELLARYEIARKALPGRYKDGFLGALEQVLEIRTHRFSDHPDFRPEWSLDG